MPKNVWPQKNFGQHFFWPNFFFHQTKILTHNFFVQKKFWPQYFLAKVLFDPKKNFGPTFFWPKFFSQPNFFFDKIFFGQKKFDQIFFGQKWILTNFVSRQIKIRPKKKFEQKKFQPKLSNSHYYNLNQIFHDLGFGIWDLGFGIWDSGFGIWDLGFWIWDWGSGTWDLGSSWPTDPFDQLGVAQLSKIFYPFSGFFGFF